MAADRGRGDADPALQRDRSPAGRVAPGRSARRAGHALDGRRLLGLLVRDARPRSGSGASGPFSEPHGAGSGDGDRADLPGSQCRRDEAGLPETRSPDAGFAAVAHAWAAGKTWRTCSSTRRMTGGDFVRNIKQLIDLSARSATSRPVPKRGSPPGRPPTRCSVGGRRLQHGRFGRRNRPDLVSTVRHGQPWGTEASGPPDFEVSCSDRSLASVLERGVTDPLVTLRTGQRFRSARAVGSWRERLRQGWRCLSTFS